jgi:hypothetical protein
MWPRALACYCGCVRVAQDDTNYQLAEKIPSLWLDHPMMLILFS